MSALQVRQFAIDQKIFAEVLACLPSSWSEVRLEAGVTETSPAGTSMQVKLDGLGQAGAAVASEELIDRVRELFVLNEEFNTDLRRISYGYTRQPDGNWAWSADYDYAS
jgi:hypothetical protein